MSAPGKAVFLSYAREDADAARRIAEALRGAGIDVWFDESELRGGDEWDLNIRRHIKECALFVPVISAHTQTRREGYFRREWNLAAQRLLDMAPGQPFLVPVVIDGTNEREALVADEFRRVQWTSLRQPQSGSLDEKPLSAFCERVRKLLGLGSSPVKTGSEIHGSPIGSHGQAAHPTANGAMRRWIWAAMAVIIVGLGIAGYFALRPITKPVSSAANQGPRTNNQEKAPVAKLVAADKSIAVLPFDNFSPDAENAFFADGMHDEVITALAKIHDLTVISRTSVMAYRKSEGRNLRKIAAELGVASVLEGSVQRAGGKVKVIVQLIDARTDKHLWAETYIEDLTDVFTIQGKLASAITSALKATLSPEEKTLIARRPTQNQDAYDLYLQARTAPAKENVRGFESRPLLERQVGLLEAAVARDPNFAVAYGELCITHCRLYWFGFLDPTPARRLQAQQALEAARRLAPEAPETHLAAGRYRYSVDNDWAAALAEYRAAERVLPNDGEVSYAIGIAQRRLGQLPEAVLSFQRSMALNPRDVTAAPEHSETLISLRRYAEGRTVAARYVEVFPDNARLRADVATAQLAVDHDWSAYVARMAALPADLGRTEDPLGLAKRYQQAWLIGDLSTAAAMLADPQITKEFGSFSGVMLDPTDLHRAVVAFCRGELPAARGFAQEALRYYRARTWNGRQEGFAMMRMGLAAALGQQSDEALSLARQGLERARARDKFALFTDWTVVANVYLVLDRRDDALALLREMMAGPTRITVDEIRHDVLWSRLKDDPRFEEILKSAKPL